ncbi:hypothetical protein F5Y14DRAFT_407124 [Nemania sp. NC0429]|nr:hypothetical protein F5Y14DRAFT_407124 [Nemania sp. NC0429]
MADARALLRAHRADNRIKHPHASYSDVGKLLCKLCHDVVKTESLWDAHIRSQSHRHRLQALQQQQQQRQQQQQQQQPSPPTQATDETTHKRKRSEDGDGNGDGDDPMSEADEGLDAGRAKRSRTDTAVNHSSTPNGAEGNGEKDKDKAQTPPGITRRISGTPIQGVEIAIPSRPATPLAGSNSAVSTPKATSRSRSLVGSDTSSISGASTSALLQQQQAATTPVPTSNEMLSTPTRDTQQTPSTNGTTAAVQTSSGAVDEAEWAAFEAEMSVLDAPAPTTNGGNASSHLYADATISAPALTTAQLATKSQEEENERRKQAAEAEMADEREDATRALETEFEEMEELEGRVRRLKERREELRKESVLNLRATATLSAGAGDADGQENVRTGTGESLGEEDEDEEDEEDEWDGFRFRV